MSLQTQLDAILPPVPEDVADPRITHMRILTLDIESSPNLALAWGTFKQTIPLAGVLEPQRLISWAGKWYGQDEVLAYTDHHDGHDTMIGALHAALEQADVVVTYNGKAYDIPHINRELLLGGYAPPAPFQQVDLYQAVKHRFRFHSGKLDAVAQRLDLGGKLAHTGMQLWVDTCVHDLADAWDLMREYNVQDVRLTEQVYDALLPWLPSHPHVGLYAEDGTNRCQRCGHTNLQAMGRAYTPLGVYRRYQCGSCRSWSRGRKRLAGVDARGIQ